AFVSLAVAKALDPQKACTKLFGPPQGSGETRPSVAIRGRRRPTVRIFGSFMHCLWHLSTLRAGDSPHMRHYTQFAFRSFLTRPESLPLILALYQPDIAL